MQLVNEKFMQYLLKKTNETVTKIQIFEKHLLKSKKEDIFELRKRLSVSETHGSMK